MKFEDLNPFLMLHPALNKIISLANQAIECSPKTLKVRIELASTPLYHTVLDKIFREAQIARFDKRRKRLYYPTFSYLGNIEVTWIPEERCWKVTITNGKKWISKRKILHELYVQKINGIYVEKEA